LFVWVLVGFWCVPVTGSDGSRANDRTELRNWKMKPTRLKPQTRNRPDRWRVDGNPADNAIVGLERNLPSKHSSPQRGRRVAR
jgi:hypothetical protein